MVLTASNMLALGTDAPDFSLTNVITDHVISLKDIKEYQPKGLCVIFACNHCPYVKHIWDKLIAIGNEYTEKSLIFVMINSNDIDNHPDDAPDKMKALAEKTGMKFPYLFDSDQSVAKAYHAACTPDFYLFDSMMKLVYRGQFDESRPGNDKPVTGKSLIAALEALKESRHIDIDHQKPSMGCNIKWKAR